MNRRGLQLRSLSEAGKNEVLLLEMVSQRALDFIPSMIRALQKNLVLWVPVSSGIMLPN